MISQMSTRCKKLVSWLKFSINAEDDGKLMSLVAKSLRLAAFSHFFMKLNADDFSS